MDTNGSDDRVSLRCPKCNRRLKGVVRTQHTIGAIHRDRRCDDCGHTFASRESLIGTTPITRPRRTQGIVYERLFISRQATILQLSRLTGLSYANTSAVLQRLVDEGDVRQIEPGLYEVATVTNA